MKTKLGLTVLFVALFSNLSWAQKRVTLHSAKAGDLYERARANEELKNQLDGVTHLTLTGIIDARDFGVLSGSRVAETQIPSIGATLVEVDLRSTTIEKYNGNAGTRSKTSGNQIYESNELPAESFKGLPITNTAFDKLTKVLLPENLQSIGSGAFQSCQALSSIDIPAGLKFISGWSTFYDSGLTTIILPENIEIKNKWKETADYTMEIAGMFGNSKITTFHVPANVTAIKENGSQRPFPETLTTLTFSPNSKLETFSGVTGSLLTSLSLPDGVKTISNIYTLSKLKYIELSSTVESISESFTRDMGALESIVCHGLFPANVKGSTFQGIPDKSKVTIYVPNIDAIAYYKEAPVWKDFTNIKVIGSDAEVQTINNFSDIVTSVGEEVTLSATASSKLSVTYSIADAGIATLSGNKLTILKEGETTITAKQAGDGINFQAVEKIVKLRVMNLTWLEVPTIIYSGSSAKVVGPKDLIVKFTRFFVNDAESPIKDGSVDLSDKTGELNLKATTADGSEIIKLKINKQ